MADRLIGAALGATLVEDGALNVRPPRLSNEPPPPARANASPLAPTANKTSRSRVKTFKRENMGSIP